MLLRPLLSSSTVPSKCLFCRKLPYTHERSALLFNGFHGFTGRRSVINRYSGGAGVVDRTASWQPGGASVWATQTDFQLLAKTALFWGPNTR